MEGEPKTLYSEAEYRRYLQREVLPTLNNMPKVERIVKGDFYRHLQRFSEIFRFISDSFDKRLGTLVFPKAIVDDYCSILSDAYGIQDFDTDPHVRLAFIRDNGPKLQKLITSFSDYLAQHFNLDNLNKPINAVPEKKRPPSYFAVTRGLKLLSDYLFFLSEVQNSVISNFIDNYIDARVEENLGARYMASSSGFYAQFEKDVKAFTFLKVSMDELAVEEPRMAANIQSLLQNPIFSRIAAFRSLPLTLISAKNLIGEKTDIGKEAISANTDAWREVGDVYFDKARTLGNVALKSATTKLRIGNKEFMVLVDPSETGFYPWAVATIKIMLSRVYKEVLEQGFSREQFKEVLDAKGRVQAFNIASGDGILTFRISKEGNLTLVSDANSAFIKILGQRNYEILRAYAMYYFAALTVADYELRPFDPDLKSEVEAQQTAGSQKNLYPIPRARILEIIDKSTTPLADAESEASLSNKLHYAAEHKRLLPRGMKPSAKNFYLAQEELTKPGCTLTPLKALIFDNNGKQTGYYEFKTELEYKDFDRVANQLETNAAAQNQFVRFETYVTGHDPKEGPRPSALEVKLNKVQGDLKNLLKNS